MSLRPVTLALLACASAAGAQTSMILPGPSGRAQTKFEILVPPAVSRFSRCCIPHFTSAPNTGSSVFAYGVSA